MSLAFINIHLVYTILSALHFIPLPWKIAERYTHVFFSIEIGSEKHPLNYHTTW